MMAELATLEQIITHNPSRNRIANFALEVAHHVYVNQPLTAYVDVSAFGSDIVRCVFSADTNLSPGRIIDLALHERCNIPNAVDFAKHYRPVVENRILDYGIRCERENSRYLRIDTAKLAIPEFEPGIVDQHFFPGSSIMNAISADGIAPEACGEKISSYGLIQEGIRRGYDIPGILERIKRFYFNLFHQQINKA